MEVQRKVNANGGVITLQDLRDLAVSAKTDCYHVVEAADDAQLGRFYGKRLCAGTGGHIGCGIRDAGLRRHRKNDAMR